MTPVREYRCQSVGCGFASRSASEADAHRDVHGEVGTFVFSEAQ